MPFINAPPKKLSEFVVFGGEQVFGFNLFKFCQAVPKFAELVQKYLGLNDRLRFLKEVFRNNEGNTSIKIFTCPCDVSIGNPDDNCLSNGLTTSSGMRECKTMKKYAWEILRFGLKHPHDNSVGNSLAHYAGDKILNWMKFPDIPKVPTRLPLAFIPRLPDIPRIPVPEIPSYEYNNGCYQYNGRPVPPSPTQYYPTSPQYGRPTPPVFSDSTESESEEIALDPTQSKDEFTPMKKLKRELDD